MARADESRLAGMSEKRDLTEHAGQPTKCNTRPVFLTDERERISSVKTNQPLKEREAGQPSKGTSRPVCLTDERETVSSAVMKEPKTPSNHHDSSRDEWLISLLKDEAGNQFRPQIQKAPRRLREAHVYRDCFDPEVVSIGPYHHGKPELQMMEKLKRASARAFVSACSMTIDAVYSKAAEVVPQARLCYSDGSTSEFDDETFTRIMFLDGCFLLHFICCTATRLQSDLTSSYTSALIMRDLFLLENQLPFVILQALLRLRFSGVEGWEMVMEFIGQRISLPGQRCMGIQIKDREPLHLLDLLRTSLLGVESIVPNYPLQTSVIDWRSFRSVKELKAVGINCKRSSTNYLKEISFKSHKIYGELSLPPIAIDQSTMPMFLNLIAYEMCPDGYNDYAVSSYICFMDALINHADDVKELRSKGIIHNFLRSDEQVADLFNKMPYQLAPDPNAYHEVKSSIEQHQRKTMAIALVGFLNTNFTSWTSIGVTAGSLALILTFCKTYFTIFPVNQRGRLPIQGDEY